MHIRDLTDTLAPSPASVLAGLDPDQRAAVTAPIGVVVVRAGAGSGKTTVLTRRIAWRALSDTADIERTLAITFTRQAATEMRARLAQFNLEGRPTIGTFHAIARQLMIQHLTDAGRRTPVIVNNRSSLVSECMGQDARNGGIHDVIAAIDWAHSHMLTPAATPDAMTKIGMKIPLGATRFVEVFEAYERLKKKRGVVDLNDFLTSVVHAAQKDPRFGESIRFQYRHISVDEAQDMNPLQYAFLTTLLPQQPDVFLVGDGNQAIYGFNGADKSLFEELPGIPSASAVYSLPSNYRCTPEIVTMAVNTLAKDSQHADAHSQRISGMPVDLRRCEDEQKEIATVIETVRRAHGRTQSWSDIAVLVRVNALADIFRDALISAGIPVRSSRRGSEWGQAVSTATQLTSREGLSVWSSDILDSGDYLPDSADSAVATLVRQFLDDNRIGSLDGRAFGSWLATSADLAETHGVEVLSFHAAKGREWGTVVVAGMEKGLMPHRSARSSTARSEEARLAYVALTRAADQLVVTWTDSRNGKSTGPSPFLPTLTTSIPSPAAPPDDIRRLTRSRSTAPSLRDTIIQWRDSLARQRRVDPAALLSDRAIARICQTPPRSLDDVIELTDAVFAHRYGKDVLEIVSNYFTN